MKIIEEPKVEDPLGENLDIHKHFTRYSRGEFGGPAVRISKSSKNITIKGSYEMEDEMTRIALELINDDELSVKGNIMSGDDFTSMMKEFGFSDEWYPEESSGKTKKYETKMKSALTVSKEKIKKLVVDGIKECYSFLNFSSEDGSVSMEAKSKPPRPSKKSPDSGDINKKLKFAKLKIPFNEENLDRVIEAFAKDFKDEIPEKYRSIVISNSYDINGLDLPKKSEVSSSEEFRLKTIRKGILERLLIKRNKVLAKNEYEFVA